MRTLQHDKQARSTAGLSCRVILAVTQNAYTSADETVYQLLVPTDGDTSKGVKPLELFSQALGVLAEFAFSIR